jgi:hypothetical protein
VRSFTEFRRKLMGFLEMIFSQEKTSRKQEGFLAYNENLKLLDFYRKMSKFK